MAEHRRMLERTNHGHYFSDCSCGWAGGVHRDRPTAIAAHVAHTTDGPAVRPVKPIVQIGPPAQGMSKWIDLGDDPDGDLDGYDGAL